MRDGSTFDRGPMASRPGVRTTLDARFGRDGRAGTVRAVYGITRTAEESGFPALPGWEHERSAGVGFPNLRCEVTTARPGYWGLLGWIQWVTQEHADARGRVELVDRLPALNDRDVPYHSYGYAPTFFDAPAYNSLPAVDWRASAWLCTLPLLSRREPVTPLCGFLWGYRIVREGSAPRLHPLRLARPADWSVVRRALASRHPAWTFEPRLARVRSARLRELRAPERSARAG